MLRIAWFSDFSPDKEFSSKSAYLSELMLPSLQNGNNIDCYAAEASTIGGRNILSWTQAMERHRKQQYDVFVYQIENIEKLDFVFKFLKQMPGIVIIHDLNCSRFYSKENVLENAQKTSLVPRISSDIDSFDTMNPLLNKFCLDPYLYSLVRIFTNPKTFADYKNLCAKCCTLSEHIEDAHAYVMSCLQAFTGDGDGSGIRNLTSDFLSILRKNLNYLNSSRAKWEKYMFYRGETLKENA